MIVTIIATAIAFVALPAPLNFIVLVIGIVSVGLGFSQDNYCSQD